jgi:hypothetical protein
MATNKTNHKASGPSNKITSQARQIKNKAPQIAHIDTSKGTGSARHTAHTAERKRKGKILPTLPEITRARTREMWRRPCSWWQDRDRGDARLGRRGAPWREREGLMHDLVWGEHGVNPTENKRWWWFG